MKVYKLLVGEGFSSLGGMMITLALPLVAITQLNASAWEVAVLGASVQAAPLLFGLSAGAIADSRNRRIIIVISNIVRSATAILLALAAWFELLKFEVLCLAGFFLSCMQLLCDSAMTSAIPAVVDRNKLTWANGWFQAIASVAQSSAPILAGVLVQIGALGPLFLVVGVSHMITSALIGRIPSDLGVRDEGDPSPHWKQIRQGVITLWSDPVQRLIALSSASFNFFHSAFFTLFPLFAISSLSFAPTDIGLVISAAGLAGLGAAVFAERLITRLSVPVTLVGSLLIVWPFSLAVVFSVLVPYPYNAILIIIAFAAWDFAVVLNLVIEHSIRQAMVPSASLSRVAATQRFVAWGVDPLGALAGGALATTALGVGHTLNLAMLGMGASGLILLASRAVRQLPRTLADSVAD